MAEPSQDDIDREVDNWADYGVEQGFTLDQWLMQAFGWDRVRAQQEADRHPD